MYVYIYIYGTVVTRRVSAAPLPPHAERAGGPPGVGGR